MPFLKICLKGMALILWLLKEAARLLWKDIRDYLIGFALLAVFVFLGYYTHEWFPDYPALSFIIPFGGIAVIMWFLWRIT
ncbi:hypothetical protein GM31_23600 [Trabulsiella odontotermitis]|uniref:Uncharacterized protein n=1 Tax=Trabulsiella odontotermitis TaxID=379893 RepID=A0A0L0GVA9_9ENTR|nr:hypothetical protein GM30_22165 [Trabulsiella odontotermitis]KNC92368.1 hypothetical protein GM31_23600 [Trabulsiella odontotermitis]